MNQFRDSYSAELLSVTLMDGAMKENINGKWRKNRSANALGKAPKDIITE